MKYIFHSNEKGSILLLSVLILFLLTIIGIAATNTSTIEILISGNDKFHKIAFYNADSGVYTTPKLISEAIDDGANPAVAAITYLDDGTDAFFREIMGFDAHDSDTDISFVLGNNNVEVDVERDRAETLAGGGAEFASGAEGAGVGSAGGVAIFYILDSFGSGPSNSLSNIGATYRKVVATAGGL